MQYQSYDCEQLAGETGRIQVRVNELGGRLDEAASNDKKITAGVILFWPALFFLGGTKDQEHEYSRLKGEYDAVQQAAVTKKCPGAITPVQAAATPVQAAATPVQAAATPAQAAATPAQTAATPVQTAVTPVQTALAPSAENTVESAHKLK